MTQRATGTAAGQPTLARYLAPGRWALIMIGVVSALINLLILASPIYMMQVYDRVLSSGSVETLVALTVMVGGAFLVLGLLEAVRSRLFARHGAWVEDRLGPEVLRASLDLRRSGATRSAGGFQDLTRLRSFYGGQGIQPLFDAPWTPIFIAVVWLLHPWLGVVTIIATLVLVALAVLNEVATRKPQGDGTRAAAALGTDTEAVIRNADVVRSLGLLRNFVARWRRGSRTASDALTRAADRGSVVIGASRFVRLFAQSAVLGVGAFLVLQAELTPGGMIAASILMGRALAPVEQAIGAWRNVVAARLSQRRLARLLAAAESLPEPQTLPALAGNVELAGVTVLPPGQRPPDAVPILRNVSFKLDPGDVLGVVGPSASGKTTLCRILVGAWQPFQGKIRLDGGELRHWDPAVLGPQIGYLPQDVELFADSVRNNIARFDPEADDAAVLAAAQAADVHDMILRLKDGYNTQIGEAGAALSAGQRQRIGLARALFGNPRFLVLDEPNANLDTQGEAALMQAIERARTGGATVVLVTHRLQILSQVTKMLVLRDGQVDRFGPRDTVLAELRGPRQVPATGQGDRAMADLAKPSNDEAERRAEPGPGAAPSPAPLAPAPAAAAVEPLNLVRLMRGPLLFALLAAFVFLGGFGTWAALVPLSSAAIAPGVVSPDGNRRTVQHLEGGIVREILVAEGDRVQVGDPVVVLEDVASRVERDLRESRLNVYRALEARLVAELAGLDELVFPEELVAMAEDDLELATAIEDQRRQFDLRVATLANREEIMRARIAQLRQEIAGRGAQIEALERQSELIDQEITSVETLVRQGLERMPRLLSLERAEAEIAGEIGENQSAIARAEQAIGETDLQIIDLRSNQRQEGAEMLVSVRNEMAEVREELLREEDALDRTIIRAPVAGTVVNLRIFTEGGVIRAGDPILDIVPEDEELIIDARVSPTDIDVVRAGLPAQIHLTAYVQRNLPRLEGEVRTVSADRLTDPQTGESYFQAIVEVPAEALDALGSDVELTPGMPVDVMIATGDHTVLTYLLAPVDRILARTFREQ